jgi:molybdopterin-guanine dinucleotide biosynthesis protein B
MSDLPVIVPRDFNELRAFAKDAADSGYFGAKNPVQALMLTMSGRDLGLSYTQALRAFHVVSGRPTMSADGMVAVCLGRKDVCAYFSTIESTPDHAIVETHRVGAPSPQRLTYSMVDAKAAGLTGKDTWRHREAGAFEVVAASNRRLMLAREFEVPADLSVHQLIAELYQGVDWVLVEGFKHSELLKVEVWRAETGHRARYADDPYIVAIATDSPDQLPTATLRPVLDVNQAEDVVDWLLQNGERFDYDPEAYE